MLKYALIGCGRIAPNHIVAADINNLEIVAVCDLIDNRAQDILKYISNDKAKKIKIFTDYKEMLSEMKPDLVAIATESGKHYEIAMDCIEHRCNLIIEKPIALNIEHAKNLIDFSNKMNVKLCACHQNRFNKAVQKVRQAVVEGKLGKLMHGTAHIRWNRGKQYYDQAKWRGTWEQDGGALMNQCIHNIDLLRWMMGEEVTEVFAFTDNLNHNYIEAEDLGLAVIKFANGAYGIIEGTTNIFPNNLEETLYLFGNTGTIKVGGKSVNMIEEWNLQDKSESSEQVKAEYHETPPNVYGFGHNPLYSDVVDAIQNNRAPYVDGNAGMRALEIILAIYKSAKTGKPTLFPLNKGSTIEFSK